jgi:hypothetical protein
MLAIRVQVRIGYSEKNLKQIFGVGIQWYRAPRNMNHGQIFGYDVTGKGKPYQTRKTDCAYWEHLLFGKNDENQIYGGLLEGKCYFKYLVRATLQIAIGANLRNLHISCSMSCKLNSNPGFINLVTFFSYKFMRLIYFRWLKLTMF